ILLIIFSYLEAPTLITAAQVNTTWNRVASSDHLWQIRFKANFPWATQSTNILYGSWKCAYMTRYGYEKQTGKTEWCWPVEKQHSIIEFQKELRKRMDGGVLRFFKKQGQLVNL